MAEARRRDAWDHTARLCWIIARALGGNDKVEPRDFHPFEKPRGERIAMTKGNIAKINELRIAKGLKPL